MKCAYKIFTDTSADMTPEFAAEQEIGIVPMTYTIEDEIILCDRVESDEARTRFYRAQRDGKMTHTSQANPESYIEAFLPYVEAGTPVLYLALSSGLSGSYNSACMARRILLEDHPDAVICCVDSLSATAGMGLLLEAAAKNRADGLSVSENADWLEARKALVQHWFMVDDLMFLKRGGRISGASAAIGTALSIKPILRIEPNGTLSVFAKKRGGRQAMMTLVQHYAETSEKPEGETVYLLHTDNAAAADFLESEVKKLNPSCVIRKLQMTPVIGSHTGPGFCAIVHFSKPEYARAIG